MGGHQGGGDDGPMVERTYVLQSEVGWRRETECPNEVLQAAAKIALDWCDKKISGKLTDQMYALKSDKLDHHGLEFIHTVSSFEEGFWSARVRYVDRDREQKRAVAGRTWTAEIVVRRQRDKVRCGIQMFMATRPGVDTNLTYDRPSLVDDLEQGLGITDGGKVSPNYTSFTAESLLQFAGWPARVRPLVILTETKERDHGFQFGLEAKRLAEQMLGIGWVVALKGQETNSWREVAGVRWAVSGGAVLVLRPGWDRDKDEFRKHDWYPPDRIAQWEYRGEFCEEGFRKFLAEKCARDLCKVHFDLSSELQFDRVLAEDVSRRRELAEHGELLPIAEEENANLKAEIESLRNQFNSTASELDETRNEKLELEDSLFTVRQQLKHWRDIAEKRTPSTQPDAEPTTLTEVIKWCGQFEGKLVLHPRARRTLKKGSYEDVPNVVGAIRCLAEEGYEYHTGSSGAKEKFESKCDELGVKFAHTITDSRAGQEGDIYFIQHNCQRMKLEFHLTKGTDRDPRNCLRIYYSWDDEEKVIVVGSLPEHLDNSLT